MSTIALNRGACYIGPMTTRTKTRQGSSERSAFERRFRMAARRVLQRRGVPEDRIEAEIQRLRQTKPAMTWPTEEELETALADLAEPR